MKAETLAKALKLVEILDGATEAADECCAHGWKVGSKYLIRTVTMAYTGLLVAVNDQEIILKDACWIADTGRFHEALKGVWGASAEHEPFPDGEVIIGRGSLIDACPLSCDLPRAAK